VAYTYDAWGNRLTETTYSNYGISTTFAYLSPQTTTTSYDGVYHLYPVQVTNPKGQSTQAGYDLALGLPLTVTDAKLQKLGPLAKIGPPLRTEKDRLALWKAIQRGLIDVVASDHAPKAKKMDDPFFEAPYGSPQSETMLTVTYDEGVNKKRD
jgi:hypothetical protein